MSWMGPTYGMWADTMDDMGRLANQADRASKSLDQWKAYAAKLEIALKEVDALYRGKIGDSSAHATLKNLALAEIERLDPANKLLDPEYRKQVGLKARDEAIAAAEKK
jgi:hypothetical protein